MSVRLRYCPACGGPVTAHTSDGCQAATCGGNCICAAPPADPAWAPVDDDPGGRYTVGLFPREIEHRDDLTFLVLHGALRTARGVRRPARPAA